MTEEEIEAYNQGWAKMMVTIMKEQVERLKITDTHALAESMVEFYRSGTVTSIEHQFLKYGIYVAAGVGKGFKHGNGGNLEFMGDDYRAAHGQYGVRQVGAGLSQHAMLSPKFERKRVKQGKNAGKEAALVSGQKRQKRDWFFRKYYYSIYRLNNVNAAYFGSAYNGLMSSYLEELFADKETRTVRSNRW